MPNKSTAVVWFRNDLRIRDHQALYEATKQYEHVVGVYILDERHVDGKTHHFILHYRYFDGYCLSLATQ